MNLFDLTGKVAFVPGGYGGIGAAIAWGLARHGAEVIVAGRDAVKAEALASEIGAQGLAADLARFEGGGEKYAWLTDALVIGIGAQTARGPVYTLYEIG